MNNFTLIFLGGWLLFFLSSWTKNSLVWLVSTGGLIIMFFRVWNHLLLMLISLEFLTLVLLALFFTFLPFHTPVFSFLFLLLSAAIGEATLGLTILVSNTRKKTSELMISQALFLLFNMTHYM